MSELRTNRIVPRNGLVANAMGGIIQTVQYLMILHSILRQQVC